MKGCQKSEINLFVINDLATFLPNLRRFGEKLTEIDVVVCKICDFWPIILYINETKPDRGIINTMECY